MTGATTRPAVAVALGAAAAAAVTPLYCDGGAARPATWWLWATIPAAAVAIAVLLAARSEQGSVRRRAFVAVTVVAAALAAVAIGLFVVDLRTGTPGGVLAVLAGCALVVTVVMAVTVLRPTARHRPARLAVTLLPVTTVALTAAGLLLAPVAAAMPEHSVTATTMSTPPVPQVPAHRDWQVQVAQSRNFVSTYRGGVVAAGAGFVTALGYPGAPDPGIAGVDGATGDLRWTYDSGRATPTGLVASPDGAHVVVVFGPRTGDRAPAGRLVVLDAMTGRVLWSRTVHRIVDNAYLAPTSSTLALFGDDLLPAGDPGTVLGLDLETGSVRWSVRAPGGCRWVFTVASATPTASLHSQRCDDRTARLVALDQATGAEQWRYTTDLRDEADVPDTWGLMDVLRTDPTGTLITLRRTITGLPSITEVLLRGSDGTELASVDAGQVWPAGPVGVVTGPDQEGVLFPEQDAVRPMDLAGTAACPQLRRVLTTATALVRHCRDDATSPDFLLVQRLEPGSEVTRIVFDDAPQTMLAAPGALVTARTTSDTVTYTGFRDG